MSDDDGKKDILFPCETSIQLGRTVIVDIADRDSVRAEEAEGHIMDHTDMIYLFTTQKIRDLIQKGSYLESWIVSKSSSLERQYIQQNKSNLGANSTPLLQEASRHCNAQIQFNLTLPIAFSFQSAFEAHDFLHIGAQFYGQTDQNKKEYTGRH